MRKKNFITTGNTTQEALRKNAKTVYIAAAKGVVNISKIRKSAQRLILGAEETTKLMVGRAVNVIENMRLKTYMVLQLKNSMKCVPNKIIDVQFVKSMRQLPQKANYTLIIATGQKRSEVSCALNAILRLDSFIMIRKELIAQLHF